MIYMLTYSQNVEHPDATHVSKVLRAYYTEAGRPLPAWLPPDPYKPPPQSQQQQPYVSSRPLGSLRSNNADTYVAGNTNNPVPSGPGGRTAGGGLGDIWADSSATAHGGGEASLRRAAAVGGANRRTGGPSWASGGAASETSESRGERRPLPSQRVGSYQTANRYADDGGDSRPGSSASGRDRLKARLGGQRAGGGGPAAGGGGGGGGGGNRYY